ncbi:MAG TPA: hypothetical protein VHX88_18425, partial [Solirubrobacteraceae bacterium]|nr:hypothetical protein [Solirubrobacteraceae bacterium]
GTAVMVAAPLAALDMPMQGLVWADGEQTTLTYATPEELARRYGLGDELEGRFMGIHAVTDAAIA